MAGLLAFHMYLDVPKKQKIEMFKINEQFQGNGFGGLFALKLFDYFLMQGQKSLRLYPINKKALGFWLHVSQKEESCCMLKKEKNAIGKNLIELSGKIKKN
jgi:hypothetical protein